MEQVWLPIIIALITSIIGPALLEWVKDKFKKPKKDPVGEAIQHNEQIDHQLELVMEEIPCNRVWIAMFHNGGHFYPTGKSIQKFSIFHERTNLETDSIMDTFQNIPVSLFPKSLAKLYNDGEVVVSSEETPDLLIFSKHQHERLINLFAIEDLENRFIGFLAIEFATEHKFNKDEFIFIRQKLGAIGTILTKYLK